MGSAVGNTQGVVQDGFPWIHESERVNVTGDITSGNRSSLLSDIKLIIYI